MNRSIPLLLAAVLAGTTSARQPEPAPEDKPAPAAPKPTETARPASPAPLPTLDELLGTGRGTAAEPAPEPGENAPTEPASELDRLLTGAELGEAFQQAVALMGDAATRLGDRKDVGVETQRVQEDVLRRLDQLLASLDKNSQQSSQSQSQSQQDESRNQPNSRRSASQQQAQQAGQPENEGERPGLREGPLKAPVESARSAWGSLPARVRDMLVQGSADRFSSKYQSMTEEYYRRLAEESK